MSNVKNSRQGISRRKVLKGGTTVALGSMLLGPLGCGKKEQAGGKVIIGAFADGGLTPFKEKIIPLAKESAGFEVTFLDDEYGVCLENFFTDAQNKAGQYDIYFLDDP